MPRPPHPPGPVSAFVALAVALVGLGFVTAPAPAPTGAVLGATAGPSGSAAAGTAIGPERSIRPLASGAPAVGDEVTASASAAPPASAAPSVVPSPTPTPPPSPDPDAPFSIDLYRRGDFVSQATKEQCVSAAMQIMLNIVGERQDRSATTQAKLAYIARALSGTDGSGTEPAGWARGLTQLGAGRYEVSVAPTRVEAIRRAVVALRRTGRSVGMLVWRGAHSWVLHGFASRGDPAVTDRFTVTRLFISDPWYPRISSIWGPSRGPDAAVVPAALPEDYLPWRRPTGRYPGMDGRFVLVLPVDEE